MLSNHIIDAELSPGKCNEQHFFADKASPFVVGVAAPIEPRKGDDETRSIVLSIDIHYLRSVRFRIALLLCSAVFAMQFMNASLNIAILSLEVHPESVNTTEKCSTQSLWGSPSFLGVVLASVNIGRLVTPLTGSVADKHRLKHLIGCGVTLASLTSVLLPYSACNYPYGVILVRILFGICDATVQPSVNRLLTIWFPECERNRAVSIVSSGNQLGMLVSLALAGYLVKVRGWPLVFYIPSGWLLFWLPLWYFWVKQNPHRHRFMKSLERRYIHPENSVVTKPTEERSCNNITSQPRQKPIWTSILQSPVLWSVIGAILCHELPLNTVFIFMPRFIKDVFPEMPIEITGLWCALPALFLLITKLLSSVAAETMQKRFGTNSQTLVAKIFNSLASASLAVALSSTVLALIFNFQSLSKVFLVTAVACGGLHVPGCLGCLVRLHPDLTGAISGIAILLISCSNVALPLLVKHYVPIGAHQEWQTVWLILAVVALLPLSFFNLFASAERQESWTAKPTDESS